MRRGAFNCGEIYFALEAFPLCYFSGLAASFFVRLFFFSLAHRVFSPSFFFGLHVYVVYVWPFFSLPSNQPAAGPSSPSLLCALSSHLILMSGNHASFLPAKDAFFTVSRKKVALSSILKLCAFLLFVSHNCQASVSAVVSQTSLSVCLFSFTFSVGRDFVSC